ncbi:hypothetical protein CIK06_21670 [Plantactinospora sp. KBS50]|nr:hypothetical protein CIK06_21670 [Plantactinospora sp. KBS50]
MVNIGLGVVFLAGIATTAYLLIDSWGGAYWIFNGVIGAVVCTLALLRERQRAWAATGGLAIAAIALVVSVVADLPREPGPVTALALCVLIGSALRGLPVPWAVAIAAGGLAVGVSTLASGSVVALFAALGWPVAVATGVVMRAVDRSSGDPIASVR